MLRKFPSAAARAKYVCRRARVLGRKLTTARDRNRVLEKANTRDAMSFAVLLSTVYSKVALTLVCNSILSSTH
jgi:hypothetical protein